MAPSVDAPQYLNRDVLKNIAPVRAQAPDRIYNFFLIFFFKSRNLIFLKRSYNFLKFFLKFPENFFKIFLSFKFLESLFTIFVKYFQFFVTFLQDYRSFFKIFFQYVQNLLKFFLKFVIIMGTQNFLDFFFFHVP